MNYENLSTPEVQRLVKQGDSNAMFEMEWRLELTSDDPSDRCAWQDYWFEKAADAGHVDAKSRYADSLLDRIMNAEDRQKAMKYFQSLVDDFDAGKLSKEHEEEGAYAKLKLGIMLCEGYHTERDAVKGAKLIEAAETYLEGFKDYGYKVLSQVGELYMSGLAQPGGEPSFEDLQRAIKYLDMAIKRFNPAKNDPNNRGYLELTKKQLEISKGRLNTRDFNTTDYPSLEAERIKMMQISPEAMERLTADKAALIRLRKRLAQEGF